MSELHTRVRQYLDKKKPAKVESITSTVKITDENDELRQVWSEFKSEWKSPALIFKTLAIVSSALFIMRVIFTVGV
jgi:hypothetical protein